MFSIETVVQSVVGSLRMGETLASYGRKVLAHVAGAFVLMAAGLFMVILAVTYLSWSGYIAASPTLGAAWSSLIVAVALLLLAAMFFVTGVRFIRGEGFARHRLKAEAKMAAAKPSPGIAGLPISVDDAQMIINLLKDKVETDPVAATIVSLCSGYVTGAVMFNRK